MNCIEIEEATPLYLSGEIDGSAREAFLAHLAQCAACAAEIEGQRALDAQLNEAAAAELPDAAAVERAVRGHIRTQRIRRFGTVAAAILFAALASYFALRRGPVTRLYADAALDHRLEVVEHQPRRWRTDPAEMEKLGRRFELSNLGALAPEGYRLEHAKMCGIDGKPALHLVYTDGRREFSIYIRKRGASDLDMEVFRVGSERLTAFQNDRLEAVIATDGSSGDCLRLAQYAKSRL